MDEACYLWSVFEYGVCHGGLMKAALRSGAGYFSYEPALGIRKAVLQRFAAAEKGSSCHSSLVFIIHFDLQNFQAYFLLLA